MEKWSELEKKVGEKVTLKGFLVESEGGEWYLSDTPVAKSCCFEKDQHHVLLEGVFPKQRLDKALCIQGTLSTEAQKLAPFSLQEAVVVETRPFPSFTLLIALSLALAFWLWRKVKAALSQ